MIYGWLMPAKICKFFCTNEVLWHRKLNDGNEYQIDKHKQSTT